LGIIFAINIYPAKKHVNSWMGCHRLKLFIWIGSGRMGMRVRTRVWHIFLVHSSWNRESPSDSELQTSFPHKKFHLARHLKLSVEAITVIMIGIRSKWAEMSSKIHITITLEIDLLDWQ
jgi:hypothetical protein